MFKKFKKSIALLVSLLILTSCTAEKGGFDDIPIYKLSENFETKPYTLENEYLKFVLDPATTYFTVEDKKSGNIWYSNEPDVENDPSGGENKNFLMSTVILESTSNTGTVSTYNNYSFCIKQQQYEIESTADSIKVKYTIGTPSKTYIIPESFSADRYDEYSSKLDDVMDKLKLDDLYKVIDLNDPKCFDENFVKNELIENYSAFADNDVVHILRSGIQDYQKEQLQTIFEGLGYTADEVEQDKSKAIEENTKPFFNVVLDYSLDGTDLVVDAPISEMRWKENYPLTGVGLLPVFGAGNQSDEGYMLVPEGMGGIINFNNGKIEQSLYNNRIYGWNYSKKREILLENNRSMFNAFAIANNGASMLCILDEGEERASVKADISGKGHGYNTVYPVYSIISVEFIRPSTRTEQTVTIFDDEIPDENISNRYKFGDTDDYVDIAKDYQEYIAKECSALTKKEDTDIPVYVELLGGINVTKPVMGVPSEFVEPLTTFDQAWEMVQEMTSQSFKNLNIVYKGWMNDGINHTNVKDGVKVLKDLGGKGDLVDFIENAKASSVDVYLEGTPIEAYGGGFSANKEATRYLTREFVELGKYSPVWFGKTKSDATNYYIIKPKMVLDGMKEMTDSISKIGATGVVFRNVGNKIYADYTNKKECTELENIEYQTQGIVDAIESGLEVITDGGNKYALDNSSAMLNIDLLGREFAIIDEKVPFYSIALKGYVDYVPDPINISADYITTLLSAVENGAALSFSFMNESTMVLQDTQYTNYYGSSFNLWKEMAYDIYNKYNDSLSHCYSLQIVDHKIIEDGVKCTTYEDGTEVYTNYNAYDYSGNGIKVPARDYIVIK